MTYKRGSRGEIVKQIQKALCGAGYHVGVIDGIFGQMTEDAVLMFQNANGLTADGIVGPATLAKLIPNRFKKSKRNITKIIIHCSATPEGEDKTVADIRDFIAAERDAMSEAERSLMTVNLKVDQDVRMGIVSDVKQELRRCSALKIMYAARKPAKD